MRTNKEIRASKVRLIGKDGGQVGIVDINDALMQAQKEGLDLVEVSPHATPPVCKIIDYGKFRYQMTKKERDNKKVQHQAKLKEIKVKPNIDEHDLMVKLKHTREFIAKGNKVRLTCTFRGREVTRPGLGERILNRVVKEVEDVAQVEAPPKLFGRNLVLVIAPIGKKR